MARPLNLFILAGEPSGDRIAADLLRRLRQRCEFTVTGVGGADLIGEGLKPLFPMSDLSVMGLRDVLLRLPLLLWRIEQTARFILAAPPDIVILVDAQEFSARLAKRLRAGGFDKPILLYVAPSVWARHPERAARIRPIFDEILAVLPFEPAAMTRLGGPETHYVGHPALAESDAGPGDDAHRIALLPGSRGGELRRHLPLFRSVVENLAARSSAIDFFMPTLPSLAEQLTEATRGWPAPVEIVADRGRRHTLYAETLFAITSAGTATLELALAGVPMIITYVMERTQARYFERLGRPRVGLPNIILDAEVTPELILAASDPKPVIAAAERLLDRPADRHAQQAAFSVLRKLMHDGLPDAPRQDPADRVLSHLPAA